MVDFGCGQNNFVQELRKRHVAGLGIDWAFPQADIKRPMHDTGLPPACADVVTSFDSLEHLLPEDIDNVLHEMRRVAMSGARFVGSIASFPSTWGNIKDLHPTVKPQSWWIKRLESVLTVEEVGRYILGTFP